MFGVRIPAFERRTLNIESAARSFATSHRPTPALRVVAAPTAADDSTDVTRTDADLSAAPPLPAAPLPVQLSADDYQQRFGPLVTQLEPPPAPKDIYTHGVLVLSIDPAAKTKDLKVGDVIVAVDGSAVRTQGEFDHVRDEDKAQTLLVCRGINASAIPVSVEAGQLGLVLLPHQLLGNEYLKSLKDGEKPSDELRLAAAFALTDLPLAYPALTAARDQHPTGSNRSWTDELTAITLFADNRYEGALTAATAALTAAPPSRRLGLIRIQAVSALATGRFDLALKIAADEPKAAILVTQAHIEGELAKAVEGAKPRPNPAAVRADAGIAPTRP